MRVLFRASWQQLCTALAACLFCFPSISLAQETTFSVTVLAPLGGCCNSAQAINEAGTVVGWSRVAAGNDHPFEYRKGQMHDLGIVGEAYAINNRGEVTGDVNIGPPTGASHCFLYNKGQITDLGTLGGLHCTGFAINDRGEVSGTSYLDSPYQHAFLYSDGQMKDLGTLGGNDSFGSGINASGQVVGAAAIAPYDFRHAFVYSNGTMQDIGTLGGQNSGALAINNRGCVVGVAQNLGAFDRAFLYSNGQMQDLGTLGGPNSIANSIDNSGQVVGVSNTAIAGIDHAFLYSNGAMKDLNDYIEPNSGWTLIIANGINDRGQIVGYGYYHGQQWSFLLTPKSPQSNDKGDVHETNEPSHRNPCSDIDE